MVLFRKSKPLPQIGREKEDAPMVPMVPELPETDLMVPIKTWEASQGWHGEDAVEPAQQAMRDARTTAVQTQQRIVGDLMLAQRTSKLEMAACGYCGQATGKDEGRMNSGVPWRYCPACWAMFRREPETGQRRLAFVRELVPDLPRDIAAALVHATDFRYYQERAGVLPTDAGGEPWSWVNTSLVRDQLLDNYRVWTSPHRAPHEYSGRCCGGCGILIALDWSAETVPVLRPGHEDEPRLPLCLDCARVLLASGGDPRAPSWSEFLFWKCLGFDMGRVEPNWAGAHGFTSYARVYADADPQFHDFTRPFGWLAEEDLAAVRDRLLLAVPNRCADRNTQALYRRKQSMAFLRDHRKVEQAAPVPQFSVTPTAPPPEDRSAWTE